MENTIDISDFCVQPDATIRQTIALIEKNARGVALLVDSERRPLAAITDGDIRRVMLNGAVFDAPIVILLDEKAHSPHPAPLSASAGTTRDELLRLMREASIHQIPLLDDAGRVVDLVTLADLTPESFPPMRAVVMAGGFGRRLHPLTDDMPKPMLPMAGRPLMENIIVKLGQAGIKHVHIATHFMPEKIRDYFGDGERFGVRIEYVSEDRPLGTAGALGLMESPDHPLLIVNGDILTDVDFRAMLAYHREHKADLTVGVCQYDLQVPFGVIETEGARIKRVREKPLYSFMANAGIYMLEPSSHGLIPHGERFDMTDLIARMIAEGRSVISFPIIEYWLDIGRHSDYEQAHDDLQNGRVKR